MSDHARIEALERQLLSLQQSLETVKGEREQAFKAGYHCRWHREQGAYCFDPAMSPGDPDGAYRAWLESALLRERPQEPTPTE